MLKARYYYSEPIKIGTADVFVGEDGSIEGVLSDPKVKCELPRATICGIWDTDTNKMSFGVSRCSSKDTFRKDVGRKLAYERALNNPSRVLTLDALDSVPELFIQTAYQLEEAVCLADYPIKFDAI